jgi:hypothetical protein
MEGVLPFESSTCYKDPGREVITQVHVCTVLSGSKKHQLLS